MGRKEEKKGNRGEWISDEVCPICGARLIFDSETHSYVCPVCGTVYGYEMVAGYYHLSHTSPLKEEHNKEDFFYMAKELVGRELAEEISKYDRRTAEEILKAVDALLHGQKRPVPWHALRKAVEILRKHGARPELEKIREERVRDAIEDECEKVYKEYGVHVPADEIWRIAASHKHLWGGRKARTVALIFIYAYCRRKYGIEIKMDSKVAKVAKALYKLISMNS